ncbi:MAG: NUDIX hydrolase [Ardenticatenaceae bacterium]|nr:NUDIX hydrolase [Ardenticatenaceae bacterium]MCB8949119.1 NUDIX hydrolase [Ardenticatenaceae bacterium]
MTVPSAPESVKFCSRCATPMETKRFMDKPRRVCPNCGFVHFTDPKVGVGVFVVHKGKILLVRRTMHPEIGKWSIPAGFLDAGENPEETAVREALEETNLQVAIEALVGVYQNPPGQGGASIFIMYKARLLGGTLQAGDDADAAAFFAPDDLPEIAFASTRAAIEQLKTQLK